MIDHVTINVSDLQKSKRFYEAAFAPLEHRGHDQPGGMSGQAQAPNRAR
ncbi:MULTISPECIES: VOC family protein [unclassified Inquilinus]